MQAGASPAIDAAAAASAFAQAHSLCTVDAGRLWGLSLCGPMMFVDPQTHQAVANEPLAGAVKDGAVYRFALPADAGIANTTVEFQGRRWVQIDSGKTRISTRNPAAYFCAARCMRCAPRCSLRRVLLA